MNGPAAWLALWPNCIRSKPEEKVALFPQRKLQAQSGFYILVLVGEVLVNINICGYCSSWGCAAVYVPSAFFNNSFSPVSYLLSWTLE